MASGRAALYLLIITLVVYRLVFFPLRALEFTPPCWSSRASAYCQLVGVGRGGVGAVAAYNERRTPHRTLDIDHIHAMEAIIF